MHFVSDPSLQRPGYIYNKHGVGYPAGAKPYIRPNIDGPLLVYSDGQLHWLNPWERILYALTLTDADKLQRKRRPDITHYSD